MRFLFGNRFRRYAAITVVAIAALAGMYALGRLQNPSQETAATVSLRDGMPRPAEARPAPTAPPGLVDSGATSLPPLSGAPLKDIFAQLQARANAGDATAATRLYRNVGFCSRLQGLDWSLARSDDELLGQKAGAMDAQQLKDYKVQLDAIEERKQVLQRFHDLCDGADAAMLGSLVPNLKRAADLGDADARACYLKQGPSIDPRGLANRPELLDGYRRSVRSMIDAGMEAGDWKVVDVVRNAYQPGSQTLLAGLLGSDPGQYYRYLKLYRLGAGPQHNDRLDQQLAAAAAALSAAQIADADAWAQKTLQRKFSGDSTRETVEGWDPCGFSYE